MSKLSKKQTARELNALAHCALFPEATGVAVAPRPLMLNVNIS